MRRAGDAGAARTGEGLQPCRNVHAIAKEVAALDHDVADMDADPEVDVTLRWQADIGSSKLRLRLDGALNCVNRADKLRQVRYPRRC